MSGMNQEKPPLVETLTVLSRRLRHLISDMYTNNLGLSESAVSLLKALSQEETEPRKQPRWTQAKLARELSLSESSLCTLVERLRQENFLDRERLVADRRKTHLRLTEKGFRAVDDVHQVEQEFAEKFWKHIAGPDDITVSAILETVSEACEKCCLESDVDRRAA